MTTPFGRMASDVNASVLMEGALPDMPSEGSVVGASDGTIHVLENITSLGALPGEKPNRAEIGHPVNPTIPPTRAA